MARAATRRLAAGLVAALCLQAGAPGESPQWRGPKRDGHFPGEGLMASWPEGGPKRLWVSTVDLGTGYASLAVTKQAIYTTGLRGKDGWLYALGLDGKLKWKRKYGPEWRGEHSGVRTTPTVDGELVYIMSGQGLIACYTAEKGEPKWAVDTVQRFGARNVKWGIAESVLIDGDRAICTPGGPKAFMAALDKTTGETVWTTTGLDDKSAYCAPILIRDGRRALIVTLAASHIVGVHADTGKLLWTRPYRNRWAAHPNSALYHDGQVYVTSNYGLGGVMLKLSEDGSSVEELWRHRVPDTHHGGVVLVDGHIYGTLSGGKLACIPWRGRKPNWIDGHRIKGAVIAAGGMLYIYDERGNVHLLRANPQELEAVSRFRVSHGSGQHWAHPVICGGRLYIRHGAAIACYDIAARPAPAGED
jgi:outer membrane protein assembly factor BamB